MCVYINCAVFGVLHIGSPNVIKLILILIRTRYSFQKVFLINKTQSVCVFLGAVVCWSLSSLVPIHLNIFGNHQRQKVQIYLWGSVRCAAQNEYTCDGV